MSDYLRDKIGEAFHDSKSITFSIHSPNLESFARGVEHGLAKALLLANEEPRAYCAGCGEYKSTPLRREEMGGYVCLTCIDKRLDVFREEELKKKTLI